MLLYDKKLLYLREIKRSMADKGIYRLKWGTCDMYYYGTSVRPIRRFSTHCSSLRLGKHDNHKLQSTYYEHGIPELEVLFFCKEGDSYYFEKAFLDLSKDDPNCANLFLDPRGKGHVHSEEFRKKIGIAHKGRVHSAESRERMSKAQKGLQPMGKNPRARKVINTITGEIYSCAKEVVDNGFITTTHNNFLATLRGTVKTNSTPFEFLDVYEANGNKSREAVVLEKPNAKKVINTITGDIYNSALSMISEGVVDLKYSNFASKLNGKRKNNTPFMYLENYENQNDKYEDTSTQGGESAMQVQHPQ